MSRLRRLALSDWFVRFSLLVLLGVNVVLFVRLSDNQAAIQRERAASIIRSCQETNARNRNTVAQLDKGIAVAKRTASPARAKRIEQSRQFTILLIEALVPTKDCQALARERVKART